MTLYNLFGWLFASLFCSLFCSSFSFTSKKSKKKPTTKYSSHFTSYSTQFIGRFFFVLVGKFYKKNLNKHYFTIILKKKAEKEYSYIILFLCN
ncbi:hypothetical protein EDC96DRAFT_527559 [Choanephora cucurbitarum]|nr:hypothetical protein EDC96DRAFT_527559 [Choanephora cucurbitarum]